MSPTRTIICLGKKILQFAISHKNLSIWLKKNPQQDASAEPLWPGCAEKPHAKFWPRRIAAMKLQHQQRNITALLNIGQRSTTAPHSIAKQPGRGSQFIAQKLAVCKAFATQLKRRASPYSPMLQNKQQELVNSKIVANSGEERTKNLELCNKQLTKAPESSAVKFWPWREKASQSYNLRNKLQQMAKLFSKAGTLVETLLRWCGENPQREALRSVSNQAVKTLANIWRRFNVKPIVNSADYRLHRTTEV